MKFIKSAIEEYTTTFQMKSRSEKRQAIAKIVGEIIIAIVVICSPFLMTTCDSFLEKDLRGRVDPTLSIEQKWELVKLGRMKIECKDNADEELRKVGLDPTSGPAMEYAIEHDLCEFELNQ